MELADRVAVVTGGGNGIGEGMCRRFVAEGASVAVVDLDGEAARRVAEEIGGLWFQADVADESDTFGVVTQVEDRLGPIDLYCANAGIGMEGGVETSDGDWQRIWEINFMSHVYVARAVLPGMLARGEGYLLHTASAAGLLTNFGAAAYSVTKHAVVALAEWLQITYGDQGLKVSALCPQFVFTGLLDDLLPAGMMAMANQVGLSPDQVAESVVEGLREESFLILPHPEVSDYFTYKATDYDRWLSGMTRLQGRLGIEAPTL
ncbi:MAG: SDR family NAD(P)-dependent oxidoreductase [bacterium]|nr:SDR family oxidoreductase [Acidimicrobiia bacterium]MCY4649392.1 SDR family NAD(P)-dependent oxidoreductase [bacterium]